MNFCITTFTRYNIGYRWLAEYQVKSEGSEKNQNKFVLSVTYYCGCGIITNFRNLLAHQLRVSLLIDVNFDTSVLIRLTEQRNDADPGKQVSSLDFKWRSVNAAMKELIRSKVVGEESKQFRKRKN